MACVLLSYDGLTECEESLVSWPGRWGEGGVGVVILWKLSQCNIQALYSYYNTRPGSLS